MTNIKKLVLIVTILLGVGLITGCSSTYSSQEPPQLAINIGDKKIHYIVAKNQWDGKAYDRQDTFKTLLSKDSKIDIPYIKEDNTAIISFSSNPPEKVDILDVLIDKNGNQIYSDKEISIIQTELKDGKCTFKIVKHPASALSSYYSKEKMDIRGYRIIATWGEDECEYAFIIKTGSF